MPSVEQAIEGFREAALLPASWPRALDRLGQALHSDGATLVLKTTTLDSIAVSNSVKPFLSQYMSGQIHDPREQRVNPSLRQGFMPDHAYFTPRDIAHEPYYQEFLRPIGFGWNATAALYGDLLISLKRNFTRGPYEGEQLELLNAILPSLRAASRVASLAWQSHFAGQLSAFEFLGRGAIMLDAKGRVLQVNARVRFGDGLDVEKGLLKAATSGDQETLRRFLSDLFAANSSVHAHLPVLRLPRPSGARPWRLDGIRCTDALRSLHSRVAALVLIGDLEVVAQPNDDVLVQFFGLAPTECALARQMLSGASLQEAAAQLRITAAHARQRLKSIFHKTQTRRQGELIALLSKLG